MYVATPSSERSEFAARVRRNSSRPLLHVDGIRGAGQHRGGGREAYLPLCARGDGAFQMTGTEISTIVRLGLNPVFSS